MYAFVAYPHLAVFNISSNASISILYMI